MYRLIIFDLDGTLINSVYDLADATNNALEELGYPTHPLDKYYHFVGNGALKLCERALPPDRRSDEEIQKLSEMFNEKYHENCVNKTRPYEGICELLDKLKEKGTHLAVASNKPDQFAKYIVESIFGKNTFDCIIGKREGCPTKPNPQIVYDLLEQMNTDKSEAVFAGDSDVDVLTAHNADIKCIGCVWGFRGEEELKAAGADFLAYKPSDFLEII
ncbi:MAG: HAD family hydrolase [Oscillospiraceae bacterium]